MIQKWWRRYYTQQSGYNRGKLSCPTAPYVSLRQTKVRDRKTEATRMQTTRVTAVLYALSATLLFSSPILAQEQGREATPGIAFTVGYGYEYAGTGVAIEWYDTVPSVGRAALLLGAGYFAPISIGGLETDPGYGVDFGVRIILVGANHRLIADIEYGFAGEAVKQINGVRTSRAFNGITLAGGYQYIGKAGFVFHATGGVTWIVGADAWITSLMGDSVITLNVGFGYKSE